MAGMSAWLFTRSNHCQSHAEQSHRPQLLRHRAVLTFAIAVRMWRHAEVNPTDFAASQLGCAKSDFPQTCLGACRNGGAEPKVFLPESTTGLSLVYSTLSSSSRARSAFEGLGRVLRHVADHGGNCALIFAGDSISHDTFLAAIAGALHLKFRLEGCSIMSKASGAARAHGSCSRSAVFGQDFASLSAGTSFLRHHKLRCERLTLRHIRPIDLTSSTTAHTLLANGSVMILNEGLWANRPAELVALLDAHVRPLLTHLAHMDASRRALVLWRETTPQHFWGRSGTGLYAERTGSATSHEGKPATACAPIDTHQRNDKGELVRDKANWRNKLFERWSRPWRAKAVKAHRTQHTASRGHAADPILSSAESAADSSAAMHGRRASVRSGNAHSSHGQHHSAAHTLPRGISGRTGQPSIHAHATVSQSLIAARNNDSLLHTSHSARWGSSSSLRTSNVSLFHIVPAFAALLPRHDLHVAPDCTHFCFTPFLWEPVWSAAADVLDSLQRREWTQSE